MSNEKNLYMTYTASEVCETLKITKRTLYNYLRTGQIKASKVGREWRFTEKDVTDFLERGTGPDYYERLQSIGQGEHETDLELLEGQFDTAGGTVCVRFGDIPRRCRVYKDAKKNRLYIVYRNERYYKDEILKGDNENV